MVGYAKARRDFEYLKTVAELTDQVELDSEREELMKNPTKKYAGELYQSAIPLWFGEHRNEFPDDSRVQQIARRYGQLEGLDYKGHRIKRLTTW